MSGHLIPSVATAGIPPRARRESLCSGRSLAQQSACSMLGYLAVVFKSKCNLCPFGLSLLWEATLISHSLKYLWTRFMLFHTVFFFQTKRCPALWHVVIESVSRLTFSGYILLYILRPEAVNWNLLGYSDANHLCVCYSVSIMYGQFIFAITEWPFLLCHRM